MREFIIKLILFFSLFTSMKSQWLMQESGFSSNLNCIHFVNQDKGFIGALPSKDINGLILMTKNAGYDWEVVYEGDSQTYIKDLKFFNNNLGIAVGQVGYPIMGNPVKGLVLITNDGGMNWNRLEDSLFNNAFLISINSYNSVDMIICGTKKKANSFESFIVYSSDSGMNWTKKTPEIESVTTFINSKITDVNTIYVSGSVFVDGNMNYKLFRTDKNLNNWEEIQTPIPPLNFDFYSKDVGMICGVLDNKPAVFKTNNGGLTWTESGFPDYESGMITKLEMMDINTIIAIGNDMQGRPLITFTNNSGNTWIDQSPDPVTNFRLSDISYSIYSQMLYSDYAYVVGENGLILKSIISDNPAAILIAKSDDLSDFSADVGSVSEVKSFKVLYKNVYNELNLVAPTNFELATKLYPDFKKVLTIDYVKPEGELEIFVRYKPESIGEHSGNLLMKNYTSTFFKLNLRGYADNTSSIDNNETKFTIYPNPVSNFITITLEAKDQQTFDVNQKVQIFDIFGLEICKSYFVGDSNRIDVSHLSTGLYYLKIGNRIEKFVKI